MTPKSGEKLPWAPSIMGWRPWSNPGPVTDVFDGRSSVPYVSRMMLSPGLAGEKKVGSKVMLPEPAAAAAASASRRVQVIPELGMGQLDGIPVGSSAFVITTKLGGGFTVRVN